ncbi:DUF4376 domain-containing protein [Microvirga sp. Mcv34]|uniref:DUF4376 domain-containing protein n=1 Tax=Microvirga sp. Mcv34 TaxID=2926016 RepID=UPI0021C62075|nr:DUF4376 domain-containing protein [Microvirga sp. Mcv34]
MADVQTYISTPQGDIESGRVKGGLPDRAFRDAWKLEGQVVSLDVALMKPIASARVKAWRDAQISAPIEVGGVTYAADEKSIDLVDRATQLAGRMEKAGQTFETEWSDVNGNGVPMGSDEINALGIAIGVRTGQMHVLARQKVQAIEAATSADEIVAILAEIDA